MLGVVFAFQSDSRLCKSTVKRSDKVRFENGHVCPSTVDCVFATNFTRLKELYKAELQPFSKTVSGEPEPKASGYYNFCAVAQTQEICKEFCKQDCTEVKYDSKWFAL